MSVCVYIENETYQEFGYLEFEYWSPLTVQTSTANYLQNMIMVINVRFKVSLVQIYLYLA